MPEVTVVITTHNLAYYLEQCLNDLYFQTMQSFDILLVDDKSTDSTREVVENWKHKFFDRLNTIYLNENKGKASLVRNEALNSGLIQGNYIVFLDGDDRLEPNFIETLYNNAARNQCQCQQPDHMKNFLCRCAVRLFFHCALPFLSVLQKFTHQRTGAFDDVFFINIKPDRVVLAAEPGQLPLGVVAGTLLAERGGFVQRTRAA